MNNFDEYKLFSERAQRLSERRQNTSQTFLTINTIIFSVVAFIIKDSVLSGWDLFIVSLPLLLVGILICILWMNIINQYKQIIGWHYEQLRRIEENLPESNKIYSNEWEYFFKPQKGRERFGFSRLEIWIPRLLTGLYLLYSIGLTFATLNGKV